MNCTPFALTKLVFVCTKELDQHHPILETIFSFYWSATKQKHTRLQITTIVIPCWVEQKTMNYGYCTASTWHAYCHKPLTKRVLSEHNGMCSLHVRYSETESWCMKKRKCVFITIGSENVNFVEGLVTNINSHTIFCSTGVILLKIVVNGSKNVWKNHYTVFLPPMK